MAVAYNNADHFHLEMARIGVPVSLLQRTTFYKAGPLCRWLEGKGLQPSRVLDAGCGLGYFTQLLQGLYTAAEVHGLDRRKECIKYALKAGFLGWERAHVGRIGTENGFGAFDLVTALDVGEQKTGWSKWEPVALKDFVPLVNTGGHIVRAIPDCTGIFGTEVPDGSKDDIFVDRKRTEGNEAGLDFVGYCTVWGSPRLMVGEQMEIDFAVLYRKPS